MPYAPVSPTVGAPGINFGYATDTTQRATLGMMVSAVDPYWGRGEFIYLKSNDTIVQGSLCVYDKSFVATLLPNTANLGVEVVVAFLAAAAGNYGWFFLGGDNMPCNAQASVAAGTVMGIGAAGQVGASSAGKELPGLKSVAASASTVVKANTITVNGSKVLQVSSGDGWFPGIALSGTGIAGGATIAAMDPSGRFVTMSAAATATGSVSVTGTYTGFNIGQASRIFAQGRIT